MNSEDSLRAGLRALPDPTPPESAWHGIVARLDAEPAGGRNAVFAIAAALVLLGIGVYLAVPPVPAAGTPDAEMAALLEESRNLEAFVHGRPLPAGTTRSALLYRIATLDSELSNAMLGAHEAPATRRLLERRVALLHSLADLGQRSVNEKDAGTNTGVRPAVLTGEIR